MAMSKKQTISKFSESSSIGEAKLISLLKNMFNARCPATFYASNHVQYDVANWPFATIAVYVDDYNHYGQ